MPTQDEVLERQFVSIGARARFVSSGANSVSLNVRRDRRGEYFELGLSASASLSVLNTDRRGRHLLFLVSVDGQKSRFLCGHDERHWFVAAIPEDERGVVNVAAARWALMPPTVRGATSKLRNRQRHRRRNAAYVRQGEWFFVPAPNLAPAEWNVLSHEPLSRGRGKSHIMEFAYREGGTVVFWSTKYPNDLTAPEYDALPPEIRDRSDWRQMVRDAEVYAMGRISHPDHATVVLKGWHHVFVNTESEAHAMRHLRFLD